MNIDDLLNEHYNELPDIHIWIENRYNEIFGEAFTKMREAHKHMKSELRPISDSELEWALTELPMELFDVAESLNKLRLDYEVVKLENKRKRREIISNVDKMQCTQPQTTRADYVAAYMAEYEIVACAYEALITRVENEISYSKEFIMGCKKVWDARRRGEQVNPISPVIPDYKMPDESEEKISLPDYGANISKSYMK